MGKIKFETTFITVKFWLSAYMAEYEDSNAIVGPPSEEGVRVRVVDRLDRFVRELATDPFDGFDGAKLRIFVMNDFAIEE